MIRNFDVDTGDIVTSGSSQFLDGKAASAASVRHRLLTFFGEYFLDITDGTPWFQSILGKNPQDVAEQAIKQRIVTDQNVIALTAFRFDSDRDARSITVDASIIDIHHESVQILFEGSPDDLLGSA